MNATSNAYKPDHNTCAVCHSTRIGTDNRMPTDTNGKRVRVRMCVSCFEAWRSFKFDVLAK